MDFQVSNKANKLTITLMVIGLIFTVLGVILGMSGSDGHFSTRFLVNMMVNGFFFFGIAMGALFFLALSYVTESYWYVTIKRVVEAVTQFIPFGIGILLVTLIIINLMDGAHIYLWMDPKKLDVNSADYDLLIDHKSLYLNAPLFWIKTLLYFAVGYLFMKGFRKRSLLEDQEGGTAIHYQNFNKGAIFIIAFGFLSTTSAIDWIMSIDVHWHSTLFGWYVFAGMWGTAMITIVLFIMYLKKAGYLPNVNESHLHDVSTWVFALSFLWSYLWFAQYMLIWYSNIPEEAAYFITRIEHFKLIYFGMFFINFVFPMLLMMSRDAKTNYRIMVFIGIVIVIGHWFDVYVMFNGGSMGAHAKLGFLEVGTAILVLGLFLRVVLTSLAKAPLMVANHPYLDESLHHDI